MTADELKEILTASGADAWELTEKRNHVWEFYFIRHRLDQNRVREVRHLRVKLFRRSADGRTIGSAGGEIPPTAAAEEAAAAIRGYLTAAAGVHDPAYSLAGPVPAEPPSGEPIDLRKTAGDLLTVMRSLPETDAKLVNSYEIFTGVCTTRFLNSEGIDLTNTAPHSQLEAVLNARSEGHEIELYRMFTMGTCNTEALRARLCEALHAGRDKLTARPTPSLGRCDVVFSGESAPELYRFFTARMNAAYKVRGYSDWSEGKAIGELTGDRVTIRAVPFLPDSSENAAFDAEGAPIRDTVMIEDGVARHFLGSRQFSCGLGLTDSFIPGNIVISGGTASDEALRRGDYLEAVDFSDFQVNPLTGDIAGEIRLAYWHHDGVVTPVSGGSVSGSMFDYIRTMRMSRRQRPFDSFLIPALTRLSGVRLTGAES